MNSRETIHFVGLFGHLGGTEKATLEEMRMLRDDGYHVVYTCITPMGRFQELLDKEGFSWHSCNYQGPGQISAFFRIWKRLNRIPALRVILVGHNIFAMLCLLLQGKRNITYMRHHYHHYGTGTLPGWKWKITYKLSSIAVKNIAYVCNYIRNEAIQIQPALKEKSCVIYNIFRMQPAVSEQEKSAAREKLNIPRNAFLIGGAGRFQPVKRWDVWCDVARRILQKNDKAQLLLAGSGTEEFRIIQLQNEFTEKVHYSGIMEKMDLFYQSLDVLLFVSDFDSTPRIPVECLCLGIPVVISLKSGGLSEILRDHEMFFSGEHNAEQLIQAIQHIHSYPVNAAELKQQLSPYSPDQIILHYKKWLKINHIALIKE